MTQPAKLTIDIYSDVMCPWCVIGYSQLNKALDDLAGGFWIGNALRGLLRAELV